MVLSSRITAKREAFYSCDEEKAFTGHSFFMPCRLLCFQAKIWTK